MRLSAHTVVPQLVAAALVAAPTLLSPGDGNTSPVDHSLQRSLDHLVATGAVGAAAETLRDGRRSREVSGSAVLDRPRQVPPQGRVRVGSVTKTFVATVVVQLAQEHRLSLDDPVDRWLPAQVPNGRAITIRHLLNHTSGLYDVVRTLPFPPSPEFYANRWRTWTAEELVTRALAQPPVFETPGSAFSYSNTNYLLLGEVIRRVTGHPYDVEVRNRIITPLHLNGTSFPGADVRIRGAHPHGYVPAPGPGGQMHLIDYTEMNPSVFGAAGEMISTPADLNRFFAALVGGRLVSETAWREMTTPGVTGGSYGLGLQWRDTTCGRRAFGNDGDALAYQAWSYVNLNGTRQATVTFAPNFRADTDAAAVLLIDRAICSP